MHVEHLVGALVAFLVTVIAIYTLDLPSRIFGLIDHPCRRKRHSGTVPLTGGIAIATGVAVSLILIPLDSPRYWSLLAGVLILLSLGILDDRHQLRAVPRLLVQVAIAALVVLAGVQVGWLGNPWGTGAVGLGAFAIPFTILAVAFMINAVNMMDGMDGLSGGVGLLALIGMFLIAYSDGNLSLASKILLFASALTAFLLFNIRFPWRPGALVFLGDSGSMVLGFVLAWFAISLAGEPSGSVAPIIVAWLLIIPAADSLAVIFRRIRRGRSPLAPDRTHLHHILQRAGFSVSQAWVVIMVNQFAWVVVAVSCHLVDCSQPRQFVLVTLVMLGYITFSLNARYFVRARLRARRASGLREFGPELG